MAEVLRFFFLQNLWQISFLEPPWGVWGA